MPSYCPITSCKKAYEIGVTEIAPMFIIGPVSHGRLGKTIWPCVSHWRESLENSSDDEFIVSTGIEYDATEFEKKVERRKLSRSKRTEPKAKRCLVQSLNKDDAGKVGDTDETKVGDTDETKGGEEKGSDRDMFEDSPETIGPSDEEK